MRAVFPSMFAQARRMPIHLGATFALEDHSLPLALDAARALAETQAVDGAFFPVAIVHVQVFVGSVRADFALDLHCH